MQLNDCAPGCFTGDYLLNRLLNADNLIFFCPHGRDIWQLLSHKRKHFSHYIPRDFSEGKHGQSCTLYREADMSAQKFGQRSVS